MTYPVDTIMEQHLAAAMNNTSSIFRKALDAIFTSKTPSNPAAATAGLRSLGTTATTAAAGNDIRLNGIASTAVTTATYTAVIGDAGKLLECNSAAAQTVTIPPDSSVNFDIGTCIYVWQYGAGQVTIQGGTGVTIRNDVTPITTDVQYGKQRKLRKRAANEWVVLN